METPFNSLDREIFEKELHSFLPEKIFDAHTHLWSEKHIGQCLKMSGLRLETNFESLKKFCSELLPGRETHFAILGTPIKNIDFSGHNEWIAKEAAKDKLSKAFMLVTPEMSQENVLRMVERHNFSGFKPYRIFAANNNDAKITEYMPEHQLEVANSKGLCVTLHLDMRHGISDERNRKSLRYLTSEYPRIKWILAHCARSFNPLFLEESIGFLKKLPNIYYDTSAVCDLYSHLLLLKYEDRKRIMYGSDLLAASGIRGKYVSYGKAWELFQGTPDITHCVNGATFVIYEQLRAQKRAAEITGLTESEIEDIFYNNAVKVFKTGK